MSDDVTSGGNALKFYALVRRNIRMTSLSRKGKMYQTHALPFLLQSAVLWRYLDRKLTRKYFPIQIPLALHVIVEAQKQGAETIGVNTKHLLLLQPDCGEQALSLVDTLIRSGSLDVVVLDNASVP
ncbi:hypothetical protein V6N12_064738 [Hibiscus sabdariffa]|uniref:RecA family profile 2 domain-containing protein n=1 Tax=Hibiscus sabdariffa TaxID=183260 RepID=A0ABR2G7Q3_9ROSI